MGAKATFYPDVQANPGYRIIKLTDVPVLVDGEYISIILVKNDLYGDMKEDWLNTSSFRKYIPPISAVGGNPLPGSQFLGDTYFLRNDWKIEPYDANHRLIIVGNLFSIDGTSPFVAPTGGSFLVQIERQFSNLVQTVASTDATQVPIDVWAYATRTLTAGTRDTEIDGLVTSVDALPLLSEIEASAVLAKEATVDALPLLSEIEASSVLAKEATVDALPLLSEIEASSVLAKEATVSALPSLSQIEASAILAKEATSVLIKAKTDGLPNGIAKNTDFNNFEFVMIGASDHVTPTAGLTVSVQRSIDGSGFAATTNSPSEVGSGVYKINLSAADMNGDVITLLFTATGADTRIVTLVTS
jgi:hypothetical protein